MSVALLRLAGPVALARLGIMGMGIIDTIVVGQAAADELPFLALGWAPTGMALVAGIGLLLGVQVLSARVIGEGRVHAAGTVLRRGLVISVVVGVIAGAALYWGAGPGLLFFGIDAKLVAGAAKVAQILALSIPLHFLFIALSYFLESIQRPNVGMAVVWLANGLNLALLLWLVPTQGAAGAAWATVWARLATTLALGAYVFFWPSLKRYGVSAADAGAPAYPAILSVGAAAAVSQFAESAAFSGMTVIAGRIGGDAVAAYQIMLMTLALVFMIAQGISTATAVLVSDAVGRGAPADRVSAGWHGLGINTIAMLAAALVVILGATPIAHGFTSDPSISALYIATAPVLAAVLAPDGGQSVAASALRAQGDNWFPTASHIFAYVVVMPPLGYYLAEMQHRGVPGLIEAIVWASVVSVAVLMARMAMLGRRAPAAARSAA